MTARHSQFEGRSYQLDLFKPEFEPKNTTTVQLPAIRKSQLSSGCSMPSRNSTQLAKVQRWAGLTRSVCNWDGLRKVSMS
jgi:hypothetical protein